MMSFLHEVCALLDAGEDIALVTIALQSGSTPRENGARMTVRADGSIVGTVGGGIMEANCIGLGKELLTRPDAMAAVRTFDLTNEQAALAAMVCGGRLTVVAERVSGTGNNVPVPEGGLSTPAALRVLRDHLALGQTCRMVSTYVWQAEATTLQREETGAPEALRFMRPAHCTVTVEGQNVSTDTACELQCDDAGCRFSAVFFPQPRLFIFGAGHVAVPTAQLAASVGFGVTVLDDRAEFASAQRFPGMQVRVLNDFSRAMEGLGVHARDYVVIMTRGHMHDRTVLEQALATPAVYVGMIGSRRKRDALYDAMRANGITQQAIDRCHCPIGMDIKARTPEEIAVSIVAELIRCRAEAS